MRPKLFTVRRGLLLLTALLFLGGLGYWVKAGMPLPWGRVPSTYNKIAFVSDRAGHPDIWMMSGKDGGDVVALTDDKPDDRQPVWSHDGASVAFVSEGRNGVTPQIFVMDAVPGARAIGLTRTSSTKESPAFGPGGRLYYLDAGKLLATDPSGGETDAILPNPEQKRPLPDPRGALFAAGGFVQTEISADGKHIAAVQHSERGDVLYLYDPSDEEQALYLVGIADRIRCAFAPDGSLFTVFAGGAPRQHPALLFSLPTSAGTAALSPDQQAAMIYNNKAITDPDSSDIPAAFRPQRDPKLILMAVFGQDGSFQGGGQLPFKPEGISVAPDGVSALLNVEEGTAPGLYRVPVKQGAGQIARLFDQPAHGCTWAPDGSALAFVSGTDIFSVPADGSAAAMNLTQGKGHNDQPAWSPAGPPRK